MMFLSHYDSATSLLAVILFLLLFALPAEANVVLSSRPNSPISTSSGVFGALQCTKNSDESYAVCASDSNVAIRYNLQPFSFAAKGLSRGNFMNSCDLYETSSQSTSRAVCAKGYSGTNGIVYFHRVSDMATVTNVAIGIAGNYPHVIVDTPNQIAYVSNYFNPPAIYKIVNIGSSTPIVAGNLTSFGSGDVLPAAILIIDGFLYVHFDLSPIRLARVNISTLKWNKTVNFTGTESYGYYDNLANDDHFIYDLTRNGILVRCTYKNNNFSRLDSLSAGLQNTYSLAISPNLGALFVMSNSNELVRMVDTTSFSMFGNSPTVSSAVGRPIITSWCYVFAFADSIDYVFDFSFNHSSCRSRTATKSTSPTTQRTESMSPSISPSRDKSRTGSVSSAISSSRATSDVSFSSSSSTSISDSTINSASRSVETTSTRTTTKTTTITSSKNIIKKIVSKTTEKTSSSQTKSAPFLTDSNSQDVSASSSIAETQSLRRDTNHNKTKTKTLLQPATTIVPPTPLPLPPPTISTFPPRRNKTRTETQTQIIVVPQIAVVAPEAASATASIAAAAGGAVGGDMASPTQAARALSLAAIATACANDVVYVPVPPSDERLPWPQGSLIPQIQISLANDDPKDSWRKHFRGAILANFVVFPLIILCIVVPLIYGIRFTKLQNTFSAKYLFSVKSRELEHRAPDLIADSRLFGVILFVFGLGLESATCAFTTLLASPRATSDSLGIDIFLCLLAIMIIVVALVLLLKVEIGANEKLECVAADIKFKSEKKKMSENQTKAARFLFGSLCWTYRGSLDSEEKIEEGKIFFLRNRNLFASNQGQHEENQQSNNSNETTLAIKANNKINEDSNSIARKISVFASFADCVLTVIAGIIRGLTVSGVLRCETAIILLVISQLFILLWALLIRPSLYPVTKILNIVMSLLLFGAALATLGKFKNASTFAVSVAMILSFLGMLIVLARFFVRRALNIIIYPQREKIVEEIHREGAYSQSASFTSPLLEYTDNTVNANNYDDTNEQVELVTAPHSPLQSPLEIQIIIPPVAAIEVDVVDIDLSSLLIDNNNNNIAATTNNNNTNNDSISFRDFPVENFNNNNNSFARQMIVVATTEIDNNTINEFIIDEVASQRDRELDQVQLCESKNDNNNDCDRDNDEEAKQTRNNLSTLNNVLVDANDLYEAETKDEKLKRLLAELDDDSDLNEAIEKRRVEESRRKQTMTKEQQEDSLRKILRSLGRK